MNAPQPDIIVVSGLPRSGTSMVMRMLAAGGVPILSDGQREADEDNPHGYFEMEAVKKTRDDPAWLAGAPGKAVKLVHLLLLDLPPGHTYRVIMTDRDLDEVLASQKKMLDRSGRTGAQLAPAALKQVYSAQMRQVEQWLDSRPDVSWMKLAYRDVIADPAAAAQRVAEFIGRPEAAAAMAGAVDPSLYRNRAGR